MFFKRGLVGKIFGNRKREPMVESNDETSQNSITDVEKNYGGSYEPDMHLPGPGPSNEKLGVFGRIKAVLITPMGPNDH